MLCKRVSTRCRPVPSCPVMWRGIPYHDLLKRISLTFYHFQPSAKTAVFMALATRLAFASRSQQCFILHIEPKCQTDSFTDV